MNKKYLLEIPR